MPFKNYSLTKGGQLTIGQIFSPDYEAGVSGWEIRKDGSAEFNNLDIRGTFNGTDFVINSVGAFFYYGTPALNTLVMSITVSGGTDLFGNTYGGGFYFTDAAGAYASLAANGGVPAFIFEAAGLTHSTLAAFLQAQAINAGAAGESQLTVLSSGKSGGDDAALQLFSEAADASAAARAVLEFGGTAIVTVSKNGVILSGQSTPPSSSGNAVLYSTTNGNLQVVDGLDSQVYGTQRRSLNTTSDSGNISGLTAIFSSPVSTRTYRIHGVLYVKAGASQTLDMNVNVPLNASGQIAVSMSRAAVLIGTTEISLNTTSGIGAALTSGDEYVCFFDGVMVPGSAGTFSLEVAASTGTLVIGAWSFIDVMPV